MSMILKLRFHYKFRSYILNDFFGGCNMIIGIDHGNKNIKVHSGKVFTSGLVSSSVPFSVNGNYIKYKDKFYALSEERLPYMRDKTLTEDFFILTLFAIASELDNETYVPGMTVNIDLGIGLPPGHFGKQYKAFENYFKHNEYIEFEYASKPFNIYIRSVSAYPQGYAAIMPVFSQIKEYSRCVIIDIGGFSLDYLQLTYGKPDMSVCDSLELGVISMYNEIKSAVNSSEDLLISESDIDAVIKNKPSVLNERIKNLINSKASIFTNKIINSLRERGIDLKSTHAIFVGGGSVLLEKYILSSKMIVSPDVFKNICSNAAGYETLLRKQKSSGR